MTFDRLRTIEERFLDWLRFALPLWSSSGVDKVRGGFREEIGLDGTLSSCARRARVQGRQSFVFAFAGKLGWDGAWYDAAQAGFDYLERHYLGYDGLYRTQVRDDGTLCDGAVKTYDQAFVLLAAAQLYEVRPEREDLKTFSRSLMRRLCTLRRYPAGGFWEWGPKRYLSNPQMHLLEAALAWAPLDQDPIWPEIAGEIVDLALRHFIDPHYGALFEEFDADWSISKAPEAAGLEPGHQFEWAWLLARWAALTDRKEAHVAAMTLFTAGQRGVDRVRNVAVDELDHAFRPRRNTARLWPQTERLKAAAFFYRGAEVSAALKYEQEVVAAAESLWRYLDVPLKGLWHDKMMPDGNFVEEAAPASSFYHIIMGVDALTSAVKSRMRRNLS